MALPFIGPMFIEDFYRSLGGITPLGRANGKERFKIEISDAEQTLIASKLENFPVRSRIIVAQKLKDITPWTVSLEDGFVHWVVYADTVDPDADVYTVCDQFKSVPCTSLGPGKATCPNCLQVKAAWFVYEIQHYSHPRAIEKLTSKLHAKARRRERYPTVYEHLLEDPLSDDYVPPPPLPRPDPPEREIIIPGTTGQREERRTSEKRRKTYAEEKAKSWRSRLKER